MSDKGIIFSASMVRALLDGRKSQTRRVLKPQPYPFNHPETGQRTWNASGQVGGRICMSDRALLDLHRKPAPGDRLYVREAFSGPWGCRQLPPRDWPVGCPIWHWADGDPGYGDWTKPKPSIHMTRWASRLTLIVTDVRLQRLNEISEADAVSEGVEPEDFICCNSRKPARHSAQQVFRALWNSLHGPDAWAANPWVAAYTFDVKRGNIDHLGDPA